MGALIYDTNTEAFKDAETPKVWGGGSFSDAEGKVYDDVNESWVDAWNDSKIYLFHNGDQCIPETGGWKRVGEKGQIISNYISCSMNYNGPGYDNCLVNTNNKVSFKSGDIIYFTYSQSGTYTAGTFCIDVYSTTDFNGILRDPITKVAWTYTSGHWGGDKSNEYFSNGDQILRSVEVVQDVSGYVNVGVCNAAPFNATIDFYDIWIERNS